MEREAASRIPRAGTTWPDTVDDIFGGDCVVTLGYVTPARGVVLTPLTNFAVRDRSAGTLRALNSSVGVWKKLERIRRSPRVAVAFHTRKRGTSRRREYVLVQGNAFLSEPVPEYPRRRADVWERVESWQDLHPLWKAWLRVWAFRLDIEIAVERILVWPDLDCTGTPEVYGAPLPSTPPVPQRPPAGGTRPRINVTRAARRAARLPDVLLGWVGADGFPVIVPVRISKTETRGIVLGAPDGVVPEGGRRAGLTAHWFDRAFTGGKPTGWGMSIRVHTGWLEATPAERRVLYAPHTKAGYSFPPSTLLYRIAAGLGTRWGFRGARRAGLLAVVGDR
jgi:hypothetical protein